MNDLYIWIIVLVLSCAIFILRPFFIKYGETNIDHENSNDSYIKKEHIFAQLTDLEYDYQMGKITKKDYERFKSDVIMGAEKFLNLYTDKDYIEKEVDAEIKQILKECKKRT